MDLSLNGILRFLYQFGYLTLPHDLPTRVFHSAVAPQGKMGTWDEAAIEAWRKYQRVQGLPLSIGSSMDDDVTLAKMCQRRCGHADNPYGLAQQVMKWPKNDLTWKFVNYTLDIPQHEISGSFNKGFGVWSAATPLNFREVFAEDKADIQITFKKLDTPGQVLAQAWFPTNGTMEFDESELWSWKLPIGAAQVDLATVVAHEAGHTIGLEHSTVRGAQMAPVYNGPMRFLTQDDISRAQALYGSRS